jgi:hypothetical protein
MVEWLNKGLIEFEDSIRLESLTLEMAVDFKKNSPNDIYVIGGSISQYINTLRELGFKDMWQVTESKNKDFFDIWNKIKRPTNRETTFVYSYVDFVLKATDANLMIFLPSKSGIVALGEKFRTYPSDEIKRTLQRYKKYSNRIYFTTGLFEKTPEEILKLSETR